MKAETMDSYSKPKGNSYINGMLSSNDFFANEKADYLVSWNDHAIKVILTGFQEGVRIVPWSEVSWIKITRADPKNLERFLEVKQRLGGVSRIPLSQAGDGDHLFSLRQFASDRHIEILDQAGSSVWTERTLTIPFWPYCSTDEGRQKKLKGQVSVLIGLFVFIWFITGLSVLNVHGNIGGLWVQFFKLVPLLLLPLYGKRSKATQLSLNHDGLRFEAQVAGSITTKQAMHWKDIKEITITQKEANQRLLDRFVLFKSSSGTTVKLKLEKIATANHWRILMDAIEKWSPATLIDVDRDLFKNLNVEQKDPSYTQLWLDALSAPPRREKLQALKDKTALHQGKYVIDRKLGSGGQGSAYLAHLSTGAQVVLKEYILPVYVDAKIRRHALESFEHEAQMLSALDSPNIVKLLDFFIEDHRGYLVLEYIDGLNLKEYVENNGPLDEETARQLAITMCDILSHLHSHAPPIVHRDFTPDNLMLKLDGSVKLIDFMVAQQNTDTKCAVAVGKHAYQPPEQFRGKAIAVSDIYGLGCTLFYLLTGHDPEPLEASHPILSCQTVSKRMDEIVAKATELEASDRYQSAGLLKEDLAGAACQEPDQSLG